jgi:NAD dependent epimerase/dehydratase family enzyme
MYLIPMRFIPAILNSEGTKNLCAAIDQLPQKPKTFIFISKVAVYGVDSGEQIY